MSSLIRRRSRREVWIGSSAPSSHAAIIPVLSVRIVQWRDRQIPRWARVGTFCSMGAVADLRRSVVV
jgi:hypothetical protein